MDERMTLGRAIGLGWEIADAYGDSVEPGAPAEGEPPARLPGLAALDDGRLLNLRVGRIRSGLEQALGSPRLADHGPGQPGGSREAFRSQLLAAHHDLLEALSVRDPLLAKAYELGGLLAGIGLEPWRAQPPERARQVREALGGPRLEAARALLDELQFALPRGSARAVERSLTRWAEWMASSASGVGWAGSTGERVVRMLRDQAESWRMLLTGEKRGEDVLGTEARVTAAQRLGVQLERLEVGHLRRFATWRGLAGVLVLGTLVAGAAVGMGPIAASAVLVLGCLGGYRVVTASLSAVKARATAALWEVEMGDAIVAAITRTPGPGADSVPAAAPIPADATEAYEGSSEVAPADVSIVPAEGFD